MVGEYLCEVRSLLKRFFRLEIKIGNFETNFTIPKCDRERKIERSGHQNCCSGNRAESLTNFEQALFKFET